MNGNPVNRHGTFAVKYEALASRFGRADLLPFWIADMDLPTAPCIREAMEERAAHPIYGYTAIPDEYFDAFSDWQAKRNGWRPDRHHMAYVSNLVQGLQLVLSLFFAEGDGIIVQPPVYFPFFTVIQNSGMLRIDNPLMDNGQHYEMDFSDLEEKMKSARAIILCNPHNPVGRVWKREELERVLALCEQYDVRVLSDEIHSDLIHEGFQIPFASLNETAKKRTVTFNSTGKSFNTAGLQGAYAIFPSQEERDLFELYQSRQSVSGANCFNILANISAYRKGEEWFEENLRYLQENIRYVQVFLKENLPRIRSYPVQGTYLMWLDFRDYGLSDDELLHIMTSKAALAPGPGHWFGPGGKGHFRFNIATHRSVVEEAMRRLKEHFS